MKFWIDKAEIKENLKLAFPIVLTQVGNASMGLVDTLVVGKTNATELAAVAAGNSVFWTLVMISSGLLFGLDTLISQAFGRRDFKLGDRILVQGLWISFFISIIVMPIIYLLAHNYHLSGAKEDICKAMLPYVHAILPSFPLIIFFNTMQKYWQAQGVAKAFTVIIIISNILNYIIDEALVLGHFGLPALGAEGVGYSTLACRVFAMLCVTYISLRHWNKNTRSLPSWKIESFWLKKLLRLGIPSAGQLSLEVFAFNFTTVLVASLGAQKMATHHIILSLSSFTFMIPLGQSVSTAVRVGYHIGRKEHELAEACGWFNIIAGSIFMLSSAAIFLIFPETLISLFTNDSEVVTTAVSIIFLCALFQFFDAIQVVTGGALRGWGDTKSVFYSNFISHYTIGLPTGLTLCFYYDKGLWGLWAGLALGLLFTSIFNILFWLRITRKYPLGRLTIESY